jgi:hypothetical protein
MVSYSSHLPPALDPRLSALLLFPSSTTVLHQYNIDVDVVRSSSFPAIISSSTPREDLRDAAPGDLSARYTLHCHHPLLNASSRHAPHSEQPHQHLPYTLHLPLTNAKSHRFLPCKTTLVRSRLPCPACVRVRGRSSERVIVMHESQSPRCMG